MAQITLNSSGVASSGSLLLQTNGTTTQATVDTSGNLGLGVTPSAWGATFTSKALQIGAVSALYTNTYDNSTHVTNNQYDAGGGAQKYIANGYASTYSQSSGKHIWSTAASGTAGNTISFTQAMTLDASGRLGIGTTSPSARLDLGNTGNATFFTANNGSDTNINFIFSTNTTTLTNNAGSGAIAFATGGSGTERARIDSSGSFFVGATSLSGNAVQIYNNSNQAGRININKTTSGLFNALVNTYSGTTVGGIDYSNTGTAFNTSSDVRLKKDIVDAGSASAKIEQIRIVSHGWKHDDEIVEFGVVAQELVNVAPQAVSAGDNGEEIERTWGVDYSKLVPMLIKAHQEQQAIITQLQADVAALKGQA